MGDVRDDYDKPMWTVIVGRAHGKVEISASVTRDAARKLFKEMNFGAVVVFRPDGKEVARRDTFMGDEGARIRQTAFRAIWETARARGLQPS